MPQIITAVPETNESVTRPIITDITNQLFAIMGLPPNTSIFYPGDLERAQQLGSGITGEEINKFPFNDRVSVQVEETNEGERIFNAVLRPEYSFIFRDDDLGIAIKPIYISTDVTITFNYRAADKVAATRWRDDMRTRISAMRDVIVHGIEYHYLIPPVFMMVLQKLYQMREEVAPYGDKWDDYFKARVTQRASLLTTLTGTQSAWGVAEKQSRVIGWFDLSDGSPDTGSKEDEGDTWTTSFSYKFKYDRIVECMMIYPLMVHNQLVDQRIRPDKPVAHPDDVQRSYALSALNFSYFERGRKQQNVLPGYAIPSFDEFIPSSIPNSTKRVFTAMTSIDTSEGGDPSLLLSMNNLGSLTMHPAILAFMVGETPYMTKPKQSIFALNLYSGLDMMPENSLTINSALEVRTTQELSLRNYYHVRLSVVTDLTLLPEAALLRLREHGTALQIILNAIDPSLAERGLLPSILRDDYIPRADLLKAIDYLNRVQLSEGDRQTRQFNTVQVLFIQTSSMNNYADR